MKINPENIDAVASAIDAASEDEGVRGLTGLIRAKLSKRARGAIYESGKWLGGIGAAVGVAAGALEGQPALYAVAACALLLSVSNLIAKANLT